MKEGKGKMFFVLMFFWIILLGMGIASKCHAGPCEPFVINDGVNPPVTVFLDDWNWYANPSYGDCMNSAIIVTRGDENNAIDAVVASREQVTTYVTLWAVIFWPGLVILTFRAIV
jgi:hypothetical protein